MEGFVANDDVWTERDNQLLADFLGEANLERPDWAVFATARLPHKSPNQIMGRYMSIVMQGGSSGSGGPPPHQTGNNGTPQQSVPQGESSHHSRPGSGLLSSVVMPTPLSNPTAVPVAAPSPVFSDYGSSNFSTQSPAFQTFDPSSLLATSPVFSDFVPSTMTPCLSTINPSSFLAPSPVFSDLGSSSFSAPSPAALPTFTPTDQTLPAFAPTQDLPAFASPTDQTLPTFTPTQVLPAFAPSTQALPAVSLPTQALPEFAPTQAFPTFPSSPAFPTLNSSTLSTPSPALFDFAPPSKTPPPSDVQTFDPSIFLATSPEFATFDLSPFMAPPSPLFPTFDASTSLAPSQELPSSFDPLPPLEPSQPLTPSFNPSPSLAPSLQALPPTFDPSPSLAPSQSLPMFNPSPSQALPTFDPSSSMAPATAVPTFNQMAPSLGVTSMRENSPLIIEDNPLYSQSTLDLEILELARLCDVEGNHEPRPAMAQAAGQYQVLVPNGEEFARSESVMVQPQTMTVRSQRARVERAKQAPPSPLAVRQVRQRKKNVQSSQKCGIPVAKGVSTRGLPWNEEEHRLFLVGLDVYGRGHWTKIARNFVLTRNPIQVASHAQKFFNRSPETRQKRRPSILDIRSIDSPTVRQPPKPLSIYDIAQWNKSFRLPPINAYKTGPATIPQQPVNNGIVLEKPQVTQPSAPNVIHVEEAVGPSSSADRKGKQPVVADEQPELSKNKKGKEIYNPYDSEFSEMWSFYFNENK